MVNLVLKLLPPRPSFPADMIVEGETVLMDQHVGYRAGLIQKDLALAFGPDGINGLAIVMATDDDEARSISGGDPAIRAGRGFRYDIRHIQAATRANVASARAGENRNG